MKHITCSGNKLSYALVRWSSSQWSCKCSVSDEQANLTLRIAFHLIQGLLVGEILKRFAVYFNYDVPGVNFAALVCGAPGKNCSHGDG